MGTSFMKGWSQRIISGCGALREVENQPFEMVTSSNGVMQSFNYRTSRERQPSLASERKDSEHLLHFPIVNILNSLVHLSSFPLPSSQSASRKTRRLSLPFGFQN